MLCGGLPLTSPAPVATEVCGRDFRGVMRDDMRPLASPVPHNGHQSTLSREDETLS
jgi:hypothetical protein